MVLSKTVLTPLIKSHLICNQEKWLEFILKTAVRQDTPDFYMD